METDKQLGQQNEAALPERERSTIAFPYCDLDAAVHVVKGVHNAGGTTCDYDQLAAELNMEAKGGAFRLRITGAQTFGVINYERGGRILLTELGRLLADQQSERAARVSAFLTVPLYQRVYEAFKGGPLPPQAGLERAIETMGVGSKVKEKARQIMIRSAKQAGFFEAAADRLVRPSIRQDISPPANDQLTSPSSPVINDGGTRPNDLHPLIQGIVMTIPKAGSEWSAKERMNWLTMAASIFKLIYTDPSNSGDIEFTLITGNGGTNSAM